MSKEMTKVLISPDFGAGWSTWCYGTKQMREGFLRHAGLIAAVERGDGANLGLIDDARGYSPWQRSEPGSPLRQFVDDFASVFGLHAAMEDMGILSGARLLVVEEIPKGTAFRVHEYDGSESITIRDFLDWYIA